MWNKANVISESNRGPNANLVCQIEEVSEGVMNILEDIMGPHASYVAIPNISEIGNQTSTEFIKDGIGIVSKITYKDNHIANCILSSIEHIGKRVDNKCHDGTTTSMYLFVSLLGKLKKLASQSKPLEFKHALENVFKYLNTILEKNSVDIEKLSQDFQVDRDAVRSNVARGQSLIATKGSKRLSDPVVAYIENTPVEDLYSFTTMDHVKIEDEGNAVELLVKEYDIEIPIVRMDESVNNYDYNSEYRGEVDLLPLEESLLRGNPKYMEIMKEIDECIEILKKDEIIYDDSNIFLRGNRDLFILSLNSNSDITNKIEELNILLRNHQRDCKGRVYQSYIRHRTKDFINLNTLYMRAIRIMSDVNVFKSDLHTFKEFLVPKININIIDDKLNVRYNKKESNSLYTIKYLEEQENEQITLYGRLVRQIRGVLDKSISSRNQKLFDNRELIAYNEILKSIITEKNTVIHVDGTSHSIQTDMSVLQDAIGSATSAIKHGFIYGAIQRFYAIIKNRLHSRKDDDDLEYKILIEFASVFESIIEIVYREYASDIIFKDEDDLREKFIKQYSDIYFNEFYEIETGKVIQRNKDNYFSDIKTLNQDVVMQPVEMFKETFFRVEEILAKYLLTKNFILP